jgi:prepilin-type N-terminal cleavage/methylation domain-containing protein
MKDLLHDLNGQSGVSLAETLIVVAIIAVVTSLALMQLGSPNTQFRRQNAARELKVAFERARFDSVKRHASTPVGSSRITINAGSPSSYTFTADSNNDGTPEVVTTSLPSDVVIAGYGSTTLPITVNFDKRGEVTTSTGAEPQFLVCNIGCGSPTISNANLVLVTPTGTVNLLGGNASPPSFNAPPRTDPEYEINPMVCLLCTPTP